jgi:hypothetical protein
LEQPEGERCPRLRCCDILRLLHWLAGPFIETGDSTFYQRDLGAQKMARKCSCNRFQQIS